MTRHLQTVTTNSEISKRYKHGTGVEVVDWGARYFRLIFGKPEMSLKLQLFKFSHF